MSSIGSKIPVATLINGLVVGIGSLIGIFLQQFIPSNFEAIIFQAIGLATILIGTKMMLKIPDGAMIIFVFSMILGGVIGEAIGLGNILNNLSDHLKSFLGIQSNNFSEGLITSFLLFCVGSMSIVGAIEEGLYGKRELILIKSTLDFFSSMALATVYGLGVLCAVIPLILFQGSISLLASGLKDHVDEELTDLISAVGGILIIGISINILKLGTINLENLLPALLVVVVLLKAKKLFNKTTTISE